MAEQGIARIAGWAATGAGVCLALGAVRQALLPTGCVGDECLEHAMRPESELVNVMWAAGGLLLLTAVAGLVWILRSRGRLGRTGTAGLACCALAVLVLPTGGVLQAVAPDAMDDLMPAFVLPGVGLLVAGVVLVAVAVLRSGLLPRWDGALLLASALALVFTNEQDARVLLLVPFALAWLVTGIVMLRALPSPTRRPAV
jgi:hypothetical protein